MATPVVKIPKKFSKGEELVVIRKRDYDAFEKWQKAVEETLKKVERGRKEYREKKTIVASSPGKFR